MRRTLLGALALFGSGTASAQDMVGDPVAGAAIFDGQCVFCHVIENEAGEVLDDRRTSENSSAPIPMRLGDMNLYGLAGRVPGSLPDTFYSRLLKAYGESGAVWEEANFVPFVLDPTGFLQHATGLGGPSAMEAGQIANEQQAHDLWAYLATFAPAAGEGAEGAGSATAP